MCAVKASFEEAVRSLRDSPLFNLSLASKELFHSNFLGWLCEMYPQPAGSLFARFLKTAPSSRGDIKVGRESKNTDLLITYSDGQQLIIENKVKSIPSEEQLRKYSAK